METFHPPRAFVANPGFDACRVSTLSTLDQIKIDSPIEGLIFKFAQLPYCFTLQNCHGHFQCLPNDEPDNNNPIPDNYTGKIRYRIAYIALYIATSEQGRELCDALASLTRIDPDFIQFGSPNWFWDQWLNSYVL